LPGDTEHLPLLSNFYIPAVNLASFLKDLSVLEQKLRVELPLIGSFSASNYQIRPAIKMNAEKADQKIYALLKAGELIINRNGGSLTGGSPEGRIKAVIVNPEYDADVKALYQNIKTVFDPKNILNPDAKLGADLKNVVRHLRTTKK
jgi:FAD/FMN-containing dehydrogenase